MSNVKSELLDIQSSSEDNSRSAERIQEAEYVTQGAYHWTLDSFKRDDSMLLFKYEYTLNQILTFNPKTVLDLGCGDGYLTHLIKKNIPNTLGVDFSEKALTLGKTKSRKLNLVCADAKKLPLKSSCMDLVCCIDILEHNQLNDITFVIREVHRVLRSDGILIISVPTHKTPLSKKHYSHFNPDELSGYLHNFEQHSIKGLWKNNTGVIGYCSRLLSNRHYSLPIIGKSIGIDLFRKLYSLCKPEEATGLFAIYRRRG
jgi:ubiquinone/menaquinone biosynthesis C-methylase UbiE